MRKYNRLECNATEYEQIQSTQFNNQSFVTEHFIGSRKRLFSDKQMVATLSQYRSLEIGGISQTQFNSFLGGFNKQLYRRFAQNPKLYNLNIQFKGVSREKNFSNWECLNDGDYFYNLDLKSAYWQSAYQLGYLSDKMFKNYFSSDEYKMAKRVCISFLARKNYMVYYPNVKNQLESFKIGCDTSVLKNVYKNIRHYLYNTMTNCVNDNIEWLEYNIDGVTVTKKDLHTVSEYFKNLNLEFKITECRKINDSDYFYGSKQRKYRNKKQI